MSDFAKPVTTDLHTAVLTEIRDMQVSQGRQFEDESPANPPEGLKRWSSSGKKWQRWLSGAWADLTDVYEITVRNALSLGGIQAGSFWHSGNLSPSSFAPASTAQVASNAAQAAATADSKATAASAAAASASSVAGAASNAASTSYALAAAAHEKRIAGTGTEDRDAANNVLAGVPSGWAALPELFRCDVRQVTPPFGSPYQTIVLIRYWGPPGSNSSGI